MFDRVLVANRGEIAVRILRALRELNIRSVAVYSEVDRGALHVQMADEAIPIGPAPSSESYLVGSRIIEAALKTGAQAIHPGYGFLSENAAFAKSCDEAGVIFIGPDWRAIEKMGSKTSARQVAIEAGAPVVPGTQEKPRTLAEAHRIAASLGYPVLLKAAAGGGGKGMRRVDRESELHPAMSAASSEAERAFGSGEVYLEKLIEHGRHIEVQVLGDHFGNLIHLGERECSIQRRHQKVVEESPSPLTFKFPDLRQRITDAALKIARSVNFSNAGTLEFLADQNGNFYFLEMNTRLQVEHPVTESVTGVDLVQAQIAVAAHQPLPFRQEDIQLRGSAIECRIYAEDPDNNFFPSPGRITQYMEPSGPGVRVDGGVYNGWSVPLEYDPLVAKLTVWANTREKAIARMYRAISEYCVLGITTNISLFSRLLMDPRFQAGNLYTGLLDDFMKETPIANGNGSQTAMVASIVAASAYNANKAVPVTNSHAEPASAWRTIGRRGLLR